MKYIDLGLSSGTLWAESNEEGYYTFNVAVKTYGDSLPTKEQLEELENTCQWKWIGDGYKVTGPNGNFITLPAAGFRNHCGYVNFVDSYGDYWSSMPGGSDIAWSISFDRSSVGIGYCERYYGNSVRLVK